MYFWFPHSAVTVLKSVALEEVVLNVAVTVSVPLAVTAPLQFGLPDGHGRLTDWASPGTERFRRSAPQAFRQ